MIFAFISICIHSKAQDSNEPELKQAYCSTEILNLSPSVLAQTQAQYNDFIDTELIRNPHTYCYGSEYCNNNVYVIIDLLYRQGVDLTDVNVVFLLPKLGHKQFVPKHKIDKFKQASLSGDFEGSNSIWGFHVIIEENGRILDLDYSDELHMAHALTYFEEMFPEVTDVPEEITSDTTLNWRDLRFKKVPALTYQKKYNAQQSSLNRDVLNYFITSNAYLTVSAKRYTDRHR